MGSQGLVLYNVQHYSTGRETSAPHKDTSICVSQDGLLQLIGGEPAHPGIIPGEIRATTQPGGQPQMEGGTTRPSEPLPVLGS